MSTVDELKQRQDDEFSAIAAIFPNEVKDLRTTQAWKTWKPLELLITLSPDITLTVNSEIATQVDLYVKCSENYPNAVPFIDIKKPQGLSNEDVRQLKQELIAVGRQNIGQEMLLELIQCTRTYLSQHQKPFHKSFYEEMVYNKLQQQKEIAEKEERQKEEQKIFEKKRLMSIEQERNRKAEALRIANRKVRTQDKAAAEGVDSKLHSTSELTSSKFVRSRSLSESSCKDVCPETVKMTLKFNAAKEFTILCGQCLNHNQRGCVIYYGIDTNSGNPVAVIKWTLLWEVSHKQKASEFEAIKKEQAQYMKQLASIEQEFKAFRHLEHNNLIHYLAMSCFQKKDRIIIYLLQEFIIGCSLSHLSKGVPLNIHQLQMYTRDVLQALQYLHKNSIIHRNIRDSSIFVCKDGVARISDYSLDKRLYDLYRSLTNDVEIDVYPPTVGKGGKKGDIYRLGIVLLSLASGEMPKNVVPDIPHSLNPSLKDFLNKCLIHNDHERWSADQLLSHPFVANSSLHCFILKDCNTKNNERNEFPEKELLQNECASSSRLLNEFEILECLGKGGFGYVVKVKNKLDSSIYALKRIPLDPSNKLLDRKIKREVKLLSRLNHENIVRYYNSWIEESAENSETSSTDDQAEMEYTKVSSKVEKSTASSVQWDMHTSKIEASSSDDDDDFDLSLAFRRNSSSSYIVFEDQDGKEDELFQEDQEDSVKNSSRNNTTKNSISRFMYIQMEFCEKSTLRTAIDNGLHQDVSLVWRLFREIIEGLHYIHQQGVIHRDLKPVNIFLDSEDHVKIGDFGLATDVISKTVTLDLQSSVELYMSPSQPVYSSDAMEDGFRTGNVGTALYVAPEVVLLSQKITYTQKVDIYSLGIIFFEMCYPPPVTAMERVKLLMNLRHRDVTLPLDVEESLSKDMVYILRWLLQHDVSKRPNASELIASDYIPPLQIEETELHNILRKTISNPQTRTFKYMINCLFQQEVSTEFDFTYDIDVSNSQLIKHSVVAQTFNSTVNTINRILQRHGAISYSVPTLMPKCPQYENESCVYVMDHGGGIINLPHNLRVSFARHIARREINQLKRFTLEKVYREQKVFGCHPREQYEYAFDIVTPTPYSFMPDAELLYAVSEIILEFTELEKRNYYICMNHVSLLKAILLYCGIPSTEECLIYDLLANQKRRNSSKLQLQNELLELEIPEKTSIKLANLVEISESMDKAMILLQPLLQSKGEVGNLAKKAVNDLNSIVKLCESFSLKLPIFICPGLCHEIKLFSGVVFQFMCDLKVKKKKATIDILAAGGRYDKLISSFKFKGLSEGSKNIVQTAAGVSIAIEKIVSAQMESEVQSPNIVDFLVYAVDSNMTKEKCKLLRELWNMGCSAASLYDKGLNVDDAVEYCRSNSISNVLILAKGEPGIIKLRTVDKERVSERKVCYSELRDHITKSGALTKSVYECSQFAKGDYQRTSSTSSTSSLPMMGVRFLLQDKTHNNRKREPNIRSHVLSTIQPTLSRTWEIIPVDLKMSVIGSIVSLCDVSDNSDSVNNSFIEIVDAHPKHRKYLIQLSEEICDIKDKKQNCAIVLYSLLENNFRVLL